MKKKPPPPAKPEPERSLYERLRDHPLDPPNPEDLAKLAEARRQELLQEARRELDDVNAIRDNLRPPPWMKQQPQEHEEDRPKVRLAKEPKVRLAKELMTETYPNSEWQTMGIRAVRYGCEDLANAKQVPLPSADSFARAMGRRPSK
jgi:hypothetical protein